jgi:uncharacterized protein (DUF885 family)
MTATADAGAIADAYLRARATVDPDHADALGQTPASRIPDFTPGAFAHRRAADDAALAALPGCRGPLAATLTERVGAEVALDEVGFTRRLLAPLATPIHQIRQVFDDLPTATEQDRTQVRRHLAEVPAAVAGLQETLRAEAARGNVVARRQVLIVADQCDRWVSDGFFATVLPADASATAPRERAAAAIAGFAGFLRTEVAPQAAETDAVGREVYEVTSAAFLGDVVDLDELYGYGWELIADLQAQAGALAVAIAGTPDVDAAAARLDADPAGRVQVGADLQRWLQTRIDAAAEVAEARLVAIPARTRAVEARMATAASGVMYYTPPDAALTRPGRVWWTVPDGTGDVATWREVSTLHHEGIPGHHLQHAVTHELTGLHPWQRYLCHVHGYAEGWAHYAEELADEIGLLDGPGERLSLVLARLWRACRIVIDLGLHLGLPIPENAPAPLAGHRTWSPELGAAALVAIAGVDPQTARFEVDRYLGWPGQALAFAVGARLWRQARAEAQSRSSGSLDLKDFHTRALGLGPMGLGPLRAALAASERSAGPQRHDQEDDDDR